MAKNTGKPSEQEFERIWNKLGKRAWAWRVVDAAEVRGRTGKIGFTRSAPSDYIVAYNGVHFAEVKSTQDDTAFRFSLLRKIPSAMAVMILAAGGDYLVYIHRITTDEWFCIPYQLIRDNSARSLTWKELERHKWKLATLT
ncbi:hypothetical protein [Mesorhizobium sp.]|uniref:hypothetical protein n=1 Tax=Mesorhizobium sp. TaxID=1871066 RepID=UPI000FE86E9C|nr:hypothetical protein [Mesorhizobium sp.]RWN60247.1 MAG: hypothetical protein EOS00_17025 [Mesorhizobium sp.]